MQVHWIVDIEDSRGEGQVNASPRPSGTISPTNEWGTYFYTNNAAGYAQAQVSRGSHVYLTTGTICYSEGPRDETFITD